MSGNLTLKEYGLKINEEKTVVIKVTREKSAETKITFRGHYLKQVDEFVHLGNYINKEGRIQKEISGRI